MPGILLDFERFIIEADLYEGKFAGLVMKKLPVEIALTYWGKEVYGPLPVAYRESKLTEKCSPGSIAWTSRGGLFCIFFGQDPAWPVEEVGRIRGEQWQRLCREGTVETLYLRPLP